MSNLLKSKFLLGVMTVAVMFVGVVAVSATTASADCSVVPTLRLGSTGESVACLQSKLSLTADGKFGPMTDAAVKAYQTTNGLTADGVVGATTAAKMNSAVAGNFPAGCTSAVGYSSTTGASCAGGTSYPAGCTSAVGYSSTTGASCAGGSTGGNSGAGSIDVDETSTNVESTAIEGQSTKMLGFKVEASDSDVSVTNLKVTLENVDAPASPYRLTNYVDSVDIYMGSTRVGSVDASEFSKSGYVYTKSIALSNAVVKMGASKKATFYVVINAASSIDTANMDGGSQPARFEILVNNIRYQDATGVVMTDGTTVTVDAPVSAGSFDSLSGAGDVKLVISKGSGTPVEGTVQISDTGSTSDIKMLEFKLKATGSDLSFDQITFPMVSVMGTNSNPVTDMIQGLEVRNGSDVLASDPVFYQSNGTTAATTSANAVFVKFLLDDTYTISEGSTDTFIVYAKIADISDFTSGSLKLSLTASGIATEDGNADVVSNESGSAVGNTQTFSATGAVLSGYNWIVNSTGTMLDFFFTVDNSAGEDVFDVVTANVNDELGASNSGTVRTDSNVYETDVAGVVTWYSGDTVTPTASTKYTVAVGDTATFRVRYSLGATATTAITSTQNGQSVEIKVNSVAGETVPSAKVTSPTATVNL